MSKGINIIGGGFKEIYLAIALKERFDKVPVFLTTDYLGGVLNGLNSKWGHLDLGCHLYTPTGPLNDVVDFSEMNTELAEPFSSFSNGKIIDGFSGIDFSNSVFADEVINTLKNISSCPNDAVGITLMDRYTHYYGEQFAKHLKNLTCSTFGLDISTISEKSHRFFPFERLLIIPSEEVIKLRSRGFEWATKLAVHNDFLGASEKKPRPVRLSQGCRSLILRLQKILKEKDIQIWPKNSERDYDFKIDFNTQSRYQIDVPILLAYFKLKDWKYSYIHDYSDSEIFRWGVTNSEAGEYFLCCECPGDFSESKFFSEIGVFAERFGFEIANIRDYEVFKLPRSYPSLYNSCVVNSGRWFDSLNYLYSRDEIMAEIDIAVGKIGHISEINQ